ncbi:5806_t:CDS:2 [Funneliformis caledonium]|uniref:5806_t:CDS:1 n=1 Tax=Funneliformis caledonium TaxID=1117310 RepID=A0A9N9FCY9_9GLOM|nr:5806_t:CDS:2 [Funneliformis caledonium]
MTPSYEDLGKEQCGQKDDENIHNFQANETLSNEHQERNKSENLISSGRDQLMNTNMSDNNINDFDLYKDDGSNGLGLSKETMRQYGSVRLIGCYGNRHLIARRLLNLEIINQQIYLTKVTEHQLCLMSEEDLESFDWNLYNTDVESDDDKRIYEFEVKKSQEVDLLDNIKTELQNTQEDGVPLHPIFIESATNQSFATRKLTKETSCMRGITIPVNEWEFSQKL